MTDDGNRPDPGPEQMARIVLRLQASSLPLGFFAFGMGTILLSAPPPARACSL